MVVVTEVPVGYEVLLVVVVALGSPYRCRVALVRHFIPALRPGHEVCRVALVRHFIPALRPGHEVV